MRQLLQTARGCPISQIYLELGQAPARFDIFKLRLLFLKYILNQEQDSLIYKMFHLKLQNPSKGDWVSSCKENLQQLEIDFSFDEIKAMSVNKFKNIICKKLKKEAFQYLMNRRGQKGSEISYTDIETAEYLLPDNNLTIINKRRMFLIRNRMLDIPSNFSSNKNKNKNNEFNCFCGNFKDMKHIYECQLLNIEEPSEKYEHIFTGNIEQQIIVLRRFDNNFEKHEKYKNNTESEEQEGITDHVILDRDPLLSVMLDYSNG